MGDTRGQDEGARDLLRRVGLRVTTVRLAVLGELTRSRTPVPAQELVERLASENVDRVTVYRTLNSLVEHGIAHKVDPGDRVFRFGLSEKVAAPAADPKHSHAHFVCDECGTVECLEEAEVVVQPKAGVNKGGKRELSRKLRLTRQDVTLHGTCEECTPVKSPKRRTTSG